MKSHLSVPVKAKLIITQENDTGVSPYCTTQAKGKAIKRVQNALPASPRKRRCVIESLAKYTGIVSSSQL